MDKCKYCGSSELELENKTKFSIMDAPQVALKCAKCGKWLKWCPKDERQSYITLENSYKEYQELCRLEEYERWADKEITKLHKQLAEKEKKIESLTTAGQYKLSPSNDKVIREMVLDGKEILMMPKDVVDYLNAYSKELADNVQCIEILRKELEKYKNIWYIDLDSLKIDKNVREFANQKAIAELERVKEFYNAKSSSVPDENGWFNPIRKGMTLNEFLDQQIKLIKGEEVI